MARVNLINALNELALLEREFARAYVAAAYRAQRDDIPMNTKVGLHRLRDELYSYQIALRDAMVPTALSSMSSVSSRLPTPRRWPDLPSPGQAIPPEFGLRGLGSGLGSPVVLAIGGLTLTIPAAMFFAAVALTVLGIAATVAYAVYVGAELVRRIAASREATRRYDAAMSEAVRRFDKCVAAGGSVADCNMSVPVPDLPPEESGPIGGSTPPWAWAAIGVAATAVLIGGVYAYSSGRAAFRRLPGAAAQVLTAGA